MCLIRFVGEFSSEEDLGIVVGSLENALEKYEDDHVWALVQSALEVIDNLIEHSKVNKYALYVVEDSSYVGIQIAVDKKVSKLAKVPKKLKAPHPTAKQGRGKYIISTLTDQFTLQNSAQGDQALLTLTRRLA